MNRQTHLDAYRAKHLWRTRQAGYSVSPREIWTPDGVFLNFSSNDYLGLSHHPFVKESSIKAIEQYGVGASASPFTGGYHLLHEALEARLKSWLNVPYVILFSNGYLANVGVVQALSERHGHIFLDKLAHASLLDGAQLSRAATHRFPHQDLPALENLLLQHSSKASLIVSEGVYSMDGDISPLPGLLTLTQASKERLLYVDDAHGFGVLAEGRGTWHHHGLPADPQVILMGTLSKALGSSGAFVACYDEAIYQTILQFTRTYLFNTALSPICTAASLAALEVIQKEPQLLMQLRKNIQFFRSHCPSLPTPSLNMGEGTTITPIQPLIIGDADKALQLSLALRKEHIWLQAIRPPTVPVNKSRLRITLNAHHTEADLERLIQRLKAEV